MDISARTASSYQLQVFTLPTGGLDECDKSLMRHDSGRQPSGRSANVDLLASAVAGGMLSPAAPALAPASSEGSSGESSGESNHNRRGGGVAARAQAHSAQGVKV